jgi:threonine aldolase
MVFATFSDGVDIAHLVDKLNSKNILLTAGNPMRLVTHLDINQADIDSFIEQLTAALRPEE